MSLPKEPPCHVPVLVDEVRDGLAIKPGMTVVDGTLGGGGHGAQLLELVNPGGTVVGVDRDPLAVEAAAGRFEGQPMRVVHGSYADLPEILAELGMVTVDGVLLDLGLSSDQLADEARGFSFMSDGELDLRFDPTRGEPAWRMLHRLSEKHLADLIYEYGEERFSRRIARKIVERSKQQPVRSAAELAELVRRSVPRTRHQRIHPATRTFQALRIAVNDELKALQQVLRRCPNCIRPHGRIAVISFHSLEDRLVKNAFRDDDRYQIITRKPIRASPAEVQTNPRARSAKLRIAEINSQEVL